MVISTISGTLVGALLGLRFRVMIIVPAIFIAAAIVTASGTARGDGAAAIAVAVIVVAASLQVGYFAGAVLRAIVGAIGTSNEDRAVLASRAPAGEVSSRPEGIVALVGESRLAVSRAHISGHGSFG
jgi:hypothetical protein